MDTNTISNECTNGGDFGTGRSDFGSSGFSGGGTITSIPEPGSMMLMGIGFAAVLFGRRRMSL